MMNPRPATDEAAGRKPLPPIVLHGHRLFFARAACVALSALTVGLFAWSILPAYEQLSTVCEGNAGCVYPRLFPEDAKALEDLGGSEFYAIYHLALALVLALGFWVIGAILFWKSSGQLMALYASIALVTFGTIQLDTLDALADAYPWLFLPVALVYFVGYASFFVLFCVFPDGRFVPRWTRWAAAAWVVYQLLDSFFPHSPVSPRSWPLLIDTALFIGLIGSLVVAQIYRYRRVSGPATRQQTKWVVFGFTAATTVLVGVDLIDLIFGGLARPGIPQVLYYLVGATIISLATLLIPLSFSISILRHRLWDIDLIIRRSLLYVSFSAVLVAVFAITNILVQYLFFTLTGEGSLITNVASVVIAVLSVAVLSRPLSDRLVRSVERLIALDVEWRVQIATQVATDVAIAPYALLKNIVETAAEKLKLPYAAITIKRDDEFTTAAEYRRPEYRRAEYRRPVREPVVKTLSYVGNELGQLILDPGKRRRPISRLDMEFMELLARQAAVTVYAIRLTDDLQRSQERLIRLTDDLQRSRERLVTTREEERRRLRRDLHDRLGPRLASLTMRAEAARDLVFTDPERAKMLMNNLLEQSQDAVSDIRELVYALRPPALDALGLIGALRAHADHYDDGVRVSVEAPEELPPLPAAVEVAAYIIALEAINNVKKHAQASGCDVYLSIDNMAGALCLEVVDDGQGIEEDHNVGVGLSTMRERADELGGSCTIEALDSGGTRVRVCLPCRRDAGGEKIQPNPRKEW